VTDVAVGERPVLAVRGLSKSFAGLRAVDDVNLVLRSGELLGVIGPNGAGKSTAINLITGLFQPTSGTVLFDGADVTRTSLPERSRLGLVRSFQSTRTFASMTVQQALLLAAEAPRARALGARKADAESTLVDFGLVAYRDRPASELPYGAQKVLNLAMVALCRPLALLLDEPFAGVGTDDVSRLSSVISSQRDAGVAVAVVEHNIEALLRLADRVVVLDSGRVIFEGTPAEARVSDAVRTAYLGHGAAAKGARR
jgi:branched-chain amino acid transport system ATP-binding protein